MLDESAHVRHRMRCPARDPVCVGKPHRNAIEPRTSETVAVIEVSPDARMVTRPCDETVATLASPVCQVAVLVRSSVVPFDKVASRELGGSPALVKAGGAATATPATVAATGEVGGLARPASGQSAWCYWSFGT